jgi:hypothetical protein
MLQTTGRMALAWLALASFALAGCSGGDKDTELPPANFEELGLEATATTGILRGIVVDDAIRPVAGADIGYRGPEGATKNTTSAADGAFGFDGLPPGTYFLEVRKAGFVAAQASAEVLAGVGEPPIVKVLLAADPSSVPYVSALVYDAFVACSFTFPVVSFAACGLVAEETNNAFLVDYEADKPPQWIQVEALWESTQALGNELGLSITDFHKGPQIGVNSSSGPSPIHVTVNETTALAFEYGFNNTITIRLFSTELTGTDVVPEEQAHAVWASGGYAAVNSTGAPAAYQSTVVDNDPTGYAVNPFSDPECVKYAVLFDSCQRAGGAGMALQQKVTVFTHIFYGYTPPSDWRFSTAGEAPAPPL